MESTKTDLNKKMERLQFLSAKYENLKKRMFSLQREMTEVDDEKVKLQQDILFTKPTPTTH